MTKWCRQPSTIIEMTKPNGSRNRDAIDAEMVRYYAARADENDDWYLRRRRYSRGVLQDEAWRSELVAAAAWLGGLPFHGRIAELAAGTGWWSPILASAGHLTLYDASSEPLAKAAARLAEVCLAADIEVRDAWGEPARSVDS